MRYVITIIMLVCVVAGHANAAMPSAPELTFAQATAIVVAAKQANPALLDLRITQTQAQVQINATIANNQNRLQAKAVGLSVLRLVKSMSLDAPPPQGADNPDMLGRGLYDYTLVLARPDAKPWLQGQKAAAGQLVQWQDVSPSVPATRQLIQQLQQQQAPPKPATFSAPPVAAPQAYEAGQAPVFGAP
jgi:hypothetical protein